MFRDENTRSQIKMYWMDITTYWTMQRQTPVNLMVWE